ncbi:hypothetical protein ACFL3Q_17275 [Planctomycetota bacterium]
MQKTWFDRFIGPEIGDLIRWSFYVAVRLRAMFRWELQTINLFVIEPPQSKTKGPPILTYLRKVNPLVMDFPSYSKDLNNDNLSINTSLMTVIFL